MPSETNLYVPVINDEAKVAQMHNAVSKPILGVWEHFAGCGSNLVATEFIADNLKTPLDS